MSVETIKNESARPLPLFLAVFFLAVLIGADKFTPTFWAASFLAGACVLTVAALFGKGGKFKKDLALYAGLYVGATVVENAVMLASLLCFPFLSFAEPFLKVCAAVFLIADAKLFFFAGKGDERITGFLGGVLILSVLCFSVYSALTGVMSAGIGFCYAIGKINPSARVKALSFTCIVLLVLLIAHLTFVDCSTAAGKDEEDTNLPPIAAAIRDGDRAAAERLAKTDAAGEDGTRALIYAVVKGDTDMVRILINAGADVNRVVDGRITAVRMALFDANVEIARMLTDAGAVIKPMPGESLWMSCWLRGMTSDRRFDFGVFPLLWKHKAPFFIEGSTIAERLFFPFGLIRFE